MRAALFCIFTYLDTKTLLRAAEVCRDWKFVARHPAVWTRVLLENARISSKVRREHLNTVCLGNSITKTEACGTLNCVCMLKILSDLHVCPLVPEHFVSVVHTDTLPHPAKPQTKAAGKEGEQGGLPEKHTVRSSQQQFCRKTSSLWMPILLLTLLFWLSLQTTEQVTSSHSD